MNAKENANGVNGWSARQFEHYARGPFWRSVPFFLVTALLIVDLVEGVLLANSSWSTLGLRMRFLLVFLIATSPLILYGVVQQQRLVRIADVPADTARRILALTFIVATWSYALIGIALELIRLASRNV